MRVALVVVASYLLGGLCAGYYLVRLTRGRDVRAAGSGSAGARNVGRVMGAWGFAMTLTLDSLKGFAAVVGAAWLGLSAWGVALALLAVVAGHIWPLQLAGRGGKGIATALGGLIAWLLAARFSLAAGLAVGILLPAMVLYAHRDNLVAALQGRATSGPGGLP